MPEDLKNSPLLKPYILGKDVKRYKTPQISNLILFPYEKLNTHLKLIENLEEFSSEYEYFSRNKPKLQNRAIISEGIISGRNKWYELQQIKTDFSYDKYIVYPDISNSVNFTLAENSYFDMTCFGIENYSLELVGILNSRLIKSFLELICVKARGGYLRLKSQYVNNLPIPNNIESSDLSNLVNTILKLNNEYDNLSNIFVEYITNQSKLSKPSKKLINWVSLSFNEFISEVRNISAVNFSKSEELDWMKILNQQKAKALELKAEIDKTDKEIDQMVYELYGLTDEEIKIVEESVKN